MQHYQNLQTALLAFLKQVPAGYYRKTLLLLASFYLVLIIADIFWLLMPSPKPANVPGAIQLQGPSAQTPGNTGAQPPRYSSEQLSQWTLFGDKPAEVPEEIIENTESIVGENVDLEAKETKLALALWGVMASSDPELSYAIIEYQGKSDLYKVGDALPAGRNVLLSKVLADRVIIDNRGEFEAVFLYDDAKDKPGTAMPATNSNRPRVGQAKTIDKRGNPEITRMASQYRQQLLTNPMSLLDVINITMAKDGQGNLLGYRVRPGKARKQFQTLGLKAGDIVTSVNGVSLDDPAKAMQLYQDLRSTTEAAFTIKRGNETVNLVIGLGAN